jgi:cell cycle sensor histidine kinase DivJ
VSHELRAPLNAIIGYSELMTERGLPGGRFGAQDRASAGRSGQQQGLGDPNYAGIIRETGEHMLGLVSTLLDLSTIEAGHYDLAPEPLDVAELVSEGCRTMELVAGRAGVAIAQDVAPNLPELQADRRACLQILLNLLSNAVKFTPAGGLVTVQARRDGERITLTVRDTGVGVLPGELPRLGEPFYRTPAGRSRSRSGCGLGLSVVRNLAALHGGRVHIASDPGAGLSATVSLPIDSAGCRATARIHTLPLGRGSIPLARAG